MNRPPDIHRLVDERHDRQSEDADRRRQLVRAGAAILAHQDAGNEGHLQEQRDGQLRIPLPPDAPRLAAPERAGDQPHQAEHDGDLRRRFRDPIRLRAGPEQMNQAGDAADGDRGEHREPRGHVEVEDLLYQPHRRFVGRARDQERGAHEHQAGQGAHRSEYFSHCYSVMSGSNIQSARVRNTRSNAARIPIHMIATGSSGAAASSAAVPRTPAIITGMMIGYNRIGSSTSRERARTSIAANSVPTAQNPSVPPASSATSSSGRLNSGAWNIKATSGTSSSSASPSSASMPSSLPT